MGQRHIQKDLLKANISQVQAKKLGSNSQSLMPDMPGETALWWTVANFHLGDKNMKRMNENKSSNKKSTHLKKKGAAVELV